MPPVAAPAFSRSAFLHALIACALLGGGGRSASGQAAARSSAAPALSAPAAPVGAGPLATTTTTTTPLTTLTPLAKADVAPLPEIAGTQPTPPPVAPAPASAAGEATESPRERGRVLQKRNPIASEYQSAGSLGRGPGAQADGEGADHRRFFPLTGTLATQPDLLRAAGFLTYQARAGELSPGGEVQVRRRFGSPARVWAFELRANVTSAERLIEHYEAAWAPLAVTDATGRPPAGAPVAVTWEGRPVYFLERPRFSQDVLDTRTRALALHGEHRLAAGHRVFVQVAWSDYLDDYFRNRIELNPGLGAIVGGEGATAQGGTSILEGRYTGAGARRYFAKTITGRETLRLHAGGQLDGERWRADYGVYHARWTNRARSDAWNFNDRDLGLATSLRDPWFPRVTVTNGIDLLDTSRGTFNDLRASDTLTRDTDLAGRVDLERRGTFARGRWWLTAGAAHRDKERLNENAKDVYLRDAARPFSLALVDEPAAVGGIVRDRYTLPAGIDNAAGRRLLAGAPGFFARSTPRSTIESWQDHYTSAEDVDAGYLLAQIESGPWEMEAGLRREWTRTRTLGTVVAPAGSAAGGTGPLLASVTENGVPIEIRAAPASDAYANGLPSFAVARRLSPRWQVRGAWAGQLMRPQYFDIVRYRRVNPPTFTLSEGNPALSPTRITNLLAAVEYKTAWLGELAFEVYETRVRDFFYSAQSYETIGADLYTVSRVENGDRGRIRGFQAQWARTIAARWAKLDLSTAYTFSESEARVPTRPADRLTLPERSRHLLRSGLEWSTKRVGGSWEVSLQSVALDEVGPSADRDGFRDRVFSLDAGLWWRLGARWRATLGGTNLTDAPERAYQGERVRVVRNQYASSSWKLGVEARF